MVRARRTLSAAALRRRRRERISIGGRTPQRRGVGAKARRDTELDAKEL